MSRDPEAHGARDAATVLPVVTAILLMPPVVLIFAAPATVAGIPLVVVFIFGVWAAAIAAALLLARRLSARAPASVGEEPPPADG